MNANTITELRRVGERRETDADLSRLDRDALLREIIAAETEPVPPSAEPPRRASSRLRVGLAAATVAVGVAVVLLAPGDDRIPLSPPDASATLRQFSLALSSQGDAETLEQGQFFYSAGERPGGRGQAWVDRDGEGGSRSWRKKDGPGKIKPITPRRPYTFGLGKRDLSYAQLVGLPRDPDRLLTMAKRDVLGRKGAKQWSGSLAETQALYRGITDFLVAMPVPSDLAASFYKVLAKLDYVHLLGPAETLAGDRGIAVGMWMAGGPDVPGDVVTADGSVINERDDLIFDPRTGALIGTRTVLNGDIDFENSLETGVVDRVGEVPPEGRP